MRERPETISQFGGVAKDVTPQALPPNLFQEDEGGERYFRGAWTRRRGMLRTELQKFDAAVTSLVGFTLPGGVYALAVVAGEEVHGFTDVDEQDFTVDTTTGGFGETEFGEDFGE